MTHIRFFFTPSSGKISLHVLYKNLPYVHPILLRCPNVENCVWVWHVWSERLFRIEISKILYNYVEFCNSINQETQIIDFHYVHTLHSVAAQEGRAATVTCIWSLQRIPPIGFCPGEGRPRAFVVKSSGVLSEGYGRDGPGVCLSDGQTEAEGIPSQGGRGDALLRYTPTHLTWPNISLYNVHFSKSLKQNNEKMCNGIAGSFSSLRAK